MVGIWFFILRVIGSYRRVLSKRGICYVENRVEVGRKVSSLNYVKGSDEMMTNVRFVWEIGNDRIWCLIGYG